MKFTVDRMAFMEVIKLAMAVAGRKLGRYNIKKIANLPSHSSDEYVRKVHKAINSAISKQYPGKEYNSLTYGKQHSINSEVIDVVGADNKQLRRITFNVCKDEVTVSASNGVIVLNSKIVGEDLNDLAYECEEEGVLTVESPILQKYLKSLEKYERLVFSHDSSSIVTIQSEQKGAIRRFEQCHYHVNPITVGKTKFVEALKPKILTDGLRNVMFAVKSKSLNGRPARVVAQVSPDKIRLVGGHGEWVAVNDIYLKKSYCKKIVGFILTRDIAISLAETFPKMQNKEMEIWYISKQKNHGIVVFKQGNTSIYTPVYKTNAKYSSVIGSADNDYKYKVSIKAEEWKSIFDHIKPPRIASNSLMNIKIDFIEGYFDVELHSNDCRIASCISFAYDSGFSYVDIKSIKNEEVVFKSYFIHLASIFQKAKPNDTLKIEFGNNHITSQKEKDERVKRYGLVRYPIKTNKSKGTVQKLVAIFHIHPGKENEND